jgi:hypothetical protein
MYRFLCSNYIKYRRSNNNNTSISILLMILMTHNFNSQSHIISRVARLLYEGISNLCIHTVLEGLLHHA